MPLSTGPAVGVGRGCHWQSPSGPVWQEIQRKAGLADSPALHQKLHVSVALRTPIHPTAEGKPMSIEAYVAPLAGVDYLRLSTLEEQQIADERDEYAQRFQLAEHVDLMVTNVAAMCQQALTDGRQGKLADLQLIQMQQQSAAARKLWQQLMPKIV